MLVGIKNIVIKLCNQRLIFYPAGMCEKTENVVSSSRGELETTSLNEMYLKDDSLDVETLGRSFAWIDTGTMDICLMSLIL